MKNRKIEESTMAYFNEEKAIELYGKISKKDFKILKILKDDQRSYVALLEIDGKRVVYKEPREKNSNSWQRFLSIFRRGESSREFESGEKIFRNGFLGAKPILAIEKFQGKKVVFSFFLMEYIDAHHALLKDLDLVQRELNKIHDKGYLHKDSQLPNFMILEDEIYLIDCKLSRNYWGIFGKIWEFIYLEKSCHSDVKLKYSDKFLYRFLKKYDQLSEKLNYYRKQIKRKLKFKGE